MPGAFPPAIYFSVLLAAVPAVIYWVCRKPARTVMWGGMRFLEDAAQKIRFRARVLDAVMVGMQTAVVALCVAAVIVPRGGGWGMGDGGWVEQGTGDREEGGIQAPDVIFVLDNSASMAAFLKPVTGGTAFSSRLESAKRCATRRLARMPEKTRVLVLPTVFTADAAENVRVTGREEAFHAVRRVEVTDAAITPGVFLAELEKWRGVCEKHGAAQKPEVIFFSDFQWPWTDAETAAFQAVMKPWGAKITCVNVTEWESLLVAETAPGVRNAAITDFRPRRLPVILGEEIFLDVTLRSDASWPTPRRMLELYEITDAGTDMAQNAGTETAKTPVSQLWADIPPEGEVTVSFQVPVARTGEHFYEVRLAESGGGEENAGVTDFYPPDDTRRVCFLAEPQWRVLIVEAWRPEAERDILTATAGTYLKSALAGISSVRADARRAAENGTLPTYLHAETLPDGRLAQTALDGFHTVILCGIPRFSEAEADALREYLKRGGGVIFFPDETADANNYAGLADILPGVPVQFTQPETPAAVMAEGNTLPVSRFWKLHAAENVAELLTLNTGEPFLLARDVFHGRTAIFAISADMRDAPLPLSGLFIPLLDQITQHAAAAMGNRRNLTAGKVGTPVFAGVYRQPWPCAVNPDLAETDALMLYAELQEQLAFSGIPRRTLTPAAFLAETENAAKNRLAACLLAVAVCLLAGENFLRWRMK